MSSHKKHLVLVILLMLPSVALIVGVCILIGMSPLTVWDIVSKFFVLIMCVLLIEVAVHLFKKGWAIWKTSGTK